MIATTALHGLWIWRNSVSYDDGCDLEQRRFVASSTFSQLVGAPLPIDFVLHTKIYQLRHTSHIFFHRCCGIARGPSSASCRLQTKWRSVLTNRSLFTSLVGFSSGVSYFAYQVKQQLVCAQYDEAFDPDNVAPQDVELWQNAICSGDKRTLEALQVLSEATVLGERVRRVFADVTGYALTHTKDLELLEWIDDDDNFPDEDHRKLTYAEDRALGEQGDVDIVKWMMSRGYTVSVLAAVGAASKGHLELVTLLHESSAAQVQLGCKEAVMKAAAVNGHLAVVRFILESRPECTRYVHSHICHDPMKDAAANGHLDIVKFLHENREKECKSIVMDGAAANGHLEIVKFLHENREEGCTTQAMDDAVKNGHLEVAKFLHENRTESCSRQAMESAVKNSDFEALKMFCQVRGEGALEGALQLAAKLGNVEYVKYLFKAAGGSDGFKLSFLPKEDLVNMAATKGYLELIKFFHKHDEYFRFSSKAMHNAAIANHLEIVKFLHENRTEGCKVDTLFECDNPELPRVLKYLCSNRPMVNPLRVIARAKRDGRLLMAAQLEYGARTAKKTYAYR